MSSAILPQGHLRLLAQMIALVSKQHPLQFFLTELDKLSATQT